MATIIPMGDNVVQKLLCRRKHEVFNFNSEEVGVNCSMDGISFRLKDKQSIQDSFKDLGLRERFDVNDVRMCAFSKKERKGYFAVMIEDFYYMPGEKKTFLCGGEFLYKIVDLDVDFPNKFFPNEIILSNDDLVTAIREKVIVPLTKKVFEEYLRENKSQLGKDKTELDFILQENEEKLLEKVARLVGSEMARVFENKITVEFNDLKISNNNHFRVKG